MQRNYLNQNYASDADSSPKQPKNEANDRRLLDNWELVRDTTAYLIASYLFWAQYASESKLLQGFNHTYEIYALIDAIAFQFTGSTPLQGMQKRVCGDAGVERVSAE